MKVNGHDDKKGTCVKSWVIGEGPGAYIAELGNTYRVDQMHKMRALSLLRRTRARGGQYAE